MEPTENLDQNLLYIADMVVKYDKWNKAWGTSVRMATDKNDSLTQFNNTYDRMAELIEADYKLTGSYQSNLYYILAYRLKNHANGKQLLDSLNKLGLENFVYWKKDKGLYLRKKLNENRLKVHPGDIAINSLSFIQLYNELEELKLKRNESSVGITAHVMPKSVLA